MPSTTRQTPSVHRLEGLKPLPPASLPAQAGGAQAG
jgi:hypothetical protein